MIQAMCISAFVVGLVLILFTAIVFMSRRSKTGGKVSFKVAGQEFTGTMLGAFLVVGLILTLASLAEAKHEESQANELAEDAGALVAKAQEAGAAQHAPEAFAKTRKAKSALDQELAAQNAKLPMFRSYARAKLLAEDVKSNSDSLHELLITKGVVTTGQKAAAFANVAPSAAASGNTTAQVTVAADGRIQYDWWVLSQGGHGLTDLGGKESNASPAAALVGKNHNYLFVIVKGLDDNLYLNQGDLGSAFVGWQPLSFQTKLAPGAASSGNTTAVVALRADGRIFYDWWQLGQGAHGFTELDGLQSNASPAAALVGDNHNYLFVIAKGLDDNLYLNQGDLGSAFVGWQPLSFQTKLAPGAASSGNTTAVVALRADGRIFYDWWQLGQGAHGFTELDGLQSNASPAASLVGDDHNYLFVIVKGLDNGIHVNQGELGKPFVGWH